MDTSLAKNHQIRLVHVNTQKTAKDSKIMILFGI